MWGRPDIPTGREPLSIPLLELFPGECALLCHLSPTKFTVEGTDLSCGCVSNQPWCLSVCQDCRSPTPGADVGAHSLDPGLAQPPRAGTRKAHSFGTPTLFGCLSGYLCPAVLSTPLCTWATRWRLLPRWDLQACPGGAHAPGAQGAGGWRVDEKAVMGPLTLELHFCGGQACTPGCLAVPYSSPFRVSPSSQHQPSPQACPLNPVSQPVPLPTDAHQAGLTGRWHGPPVCPACLELPGPPVSHWSSFSVQALSPQVSGLPRVWELFLSSAPSHPFFLPSYVEIFLILSGVWGLPLVSSRC